MQVIQVEINQLRPSEYNPRKWEEDAIKNLTESIQLFGMVDPIIVNEAENRKNIIIGGHFRFKVAKDLGFKTVPCIFVNIPDETKERELNLRLNKNLGAFDFELLANFDEELLLSIGFTNEELTVGFGLDKAERQEFDYDRLNVLTVQPPEAPRLKERAEIELDNIEDFKKVKEAIESGRLTKEKILNLL